VTRLKYQKPREKLIKLAESCLIEPVHYRSDKTRALESVSENGHHYILQ